MRCSRVRLGLAAAGIAVAAACVTGAATTAAARSEPRVAVVIDVGGGCPGTVTLRLCDGVRRATRRTGVQARIMSPTFRESPVDFLGLIAQQRYDAVVLFGLAAAPQVAAVARRYPKVAFVVMDASRADVPKAPPNVAAEVLQTREAAFLAGWLAAKLEQRRPGPDVVGAVGGFPIPGVTTSVDGFAAGARHAVPGVRVLVDYSYDFVDPSKCAALAGRQIARGAGTVFNVAEACGLGTMQTAADAGVWAIGGASDQSFLGPHVLTSVLKSYAAGFVDVFSRVKAGTLRTGRDTTLTMRDGAAGLGRISRKVPRPLITQLHRLERQIKTGKLRVSVASSG